MNEIDKKLKIAIVSFDWRNLFENDFDGIIRKLRRDHLNPGLNNFFFLSWSKVSYYQEKGNIKSFHIKAPLGKRFFCDLVSVFILPFVLKKRNFQPDVLLVYDFPLVFSGFFVKLIWGTKIILFLSNLPKELAGTRQFSFLKKIYQGCCEFLGRGPVDRYICISEPTRKYLLSLGIRDSKINLVQPDTISSEKELIDSAQKGVIRREFGISDDKKIILSVGRLEKEKGFDTLIELFSSIKREDFYLIIVGGGTEKANLVELAGKSGAAERVIFPGQVSHKKIWNYYADADVFVLLSRSEGLGLVFWEAMYMEIPVVGSRVGGIVQTIGENQERGYFWEPEMKAGGFQEILEKCWSNRTKIEVARSYVREKLKPSKNINEII